MMRPMIATTAALFCILKLTKPINVPVSVETTPAFASPMIAMNNPIPTATAFFKLSGIDLMIASRIPQIERIMNKIPSSNTAVNANCHEQPIPRTTEKVKNALRPRPGARATGRFATKAITNVARAAAIAVAVNTGPHSIPEPERMLGFTARM